MSKLEINGLRASVGGLEILRGIDLTVSSGQVHAIMGPNGAGKSTLGNVLMGSPLYTEVSGSIRIDGFELIGLPTYQRALAGLYLAPQDPVEIPGVPLSSVLTEALHALGHDGEADTPESVREVVAREAELIGVSPMILDRALNVDASGGEKKRLETLQLAVLEPRIAVLDEIDSGLDIDALRDVARRVNDRVRGQSSMDRSEPLGVLAITHYRRLFNELRPDFVHVLVHGAIVASGGPELAEEIDEEGYGAYLELAGPSPS